MHFNPEMILTYALIAYSIILHEVAHGYAALKFGDDTAERMDRLTMNPLVHVDPIGTILFPALQLLTTGQVWLGWAKPVPVNPNRLEPRVAGEVVVALAGIMVNIAIAVAMAVLLGFAPRGKLWYVIFGTMYANVALAVFNLLPIPPLDGHHVVKQLLPPDLRERYERIGMTGVFLLLVLSASGYLSPIIGPPIDFLTSLLYSQITNRIGR